MERFAHSVEGNPESCWEPLAAHCREVGERAASFASAFGAGPLALAAGMLHDIGKWSEEYQLYIRRSREDGEGRKGPDHSTAGAKAVMKLLGPTMGKLLAFGIAGHHGGLMDGADLMRRLDKDVPSHEGWQEALSDLPEPRALAQGFSRPRGNVIDEAFGLPFLARMLFSTLVDADFLETERFYAKSRGEAVPDRGGTLTAAHRDRVRAFMAGHRKQDTPVNALRSRILDHAVEKAALPPGLFTLTVPTGGGKTLTSLSFALDHALAHELRRVVHISPFAEAWVETPRRRGCCARPPVASRAEAWVETCHARPSARRLPVASRAEAWVETAVLELEERGDASPPARRRGSKHARAGREDQGDGRLPRGGVGRNSLAVAAPNPGRGVASRAEAWVETGTCPISTPTPWSPPAPRRGSKHVPGARRGHTHAVASRAEAWVETSRSERCHSMTACRLPRGGVGRNRIARHFLAHFARVASRAEAWVETDHERPTSRVVAGRLPRGGVGRNLATAITKRVPVVASRAEAWVETTPTMRRTRGPAVASRAEAWVETKMR